MAESAELNKDKVAKLKRRRASKKGHVTRRITELDRLVSEGGSRSKIRYLLEALMDKYKEVGDIHEEIVPLIDADDSDWLEEVKINVDRCASEVHEYFERRREDPPSEEYTKSWIENLSSSSLSDPSVKCNDKDPNPAQEPVSTVEPSKLDSGLDTAFGTNITSQLDSKSDTAFETNTIFGTNPTSTLDSDFGMDMNLCFGVKSDKMMASGFRGNPMLFGQVAPGGGGSLYMNTSTIPSLDSRWQQLPSQLQQDDRGEMPNSPAFTSWRENNQHNILTDSSDSSNAKPTRPVIFTSVPSSQVDADKRFSLQSASLQSHSCRPRTSYSASNLGNMIGHINRQPLSMSSYNMSTSAASNPGIYSHIGMHPSAMSSCLRTGAASNLSQHGHVGMQPLKTSSYPCTSAACTSASHHNIGQTMTQRLPMNSSFINDVDSWIDQLCVSGTQAHTAAAITPDVQMAWLVQQSLPRNQIPTFDGSPSKWVDFITKFRDIVHNQQYLNDRQRCMYLLQHLQSNAERAVKGFANDCHGYALSLKRLKFLFGQK